MTPATTLATPVPVTVSGTAFAVGLMAASAVTAATVPTVTSAGEAA
ncbi:hypothetical protein [Streptosporangium oxazolinicum]